MVRSTVSAGNEVPSDAQTSSHRPKTGRSQYRPMKRHALKLNAFGRIIAIERKGDAWLAFDWGNEGKHRLATDIAIPPFLEKEEIMGYLDDLLHESASMDFPHVIILHQ